MLRESSPEIRSRLAHVFCGLKGSIEGYSTPLLAWKQRYPTLEGVFLPGFWRARCQLGLLPPRKGSGERGTVLWRCVSTGSSPSSVPTTVTYPSARATRKGTEVTAGARALCFFSFSLLVGNTRTMKTRRRCSLGRGLFVACVSCSSRQKDVEEAGSSGREILFGV